MGPVQAGPNHGRAYMGPTTLKTVWGLHGGYMTYMGLLNWVPYLEQSCNMGSVWALCDLNGLAQLGPTSHPGHASAGTQVGDP